MTIGGSDTHLFASCIDFGFRRSATLCGIRLQRDRFAQGDQEATCPVCRGLYDELLAGEKQSLERDMDVAFKAELRRLHEHRTRHPYRNEIFSGIEAAAIAL